MKKFFITSLISAIMVGCGSAPELTSSQSSALTNASASNTNPHTTIMSAPLPGNVCAVGGVRGKWNVGDSFQFGVTTVAGIKYYQLNVGGTDTASISANCVPVSAFTHGGVPAVSVQVSAVSATNPTYEGISGLPTVWSFGQMSVNTGAGGIWVGETDFGVPSLIVQSGGGNGTVSGATLGFTLLDAGGSPIPIPYSALTTCDGDTGGAIQKDFGCIPVSQGFCWTTSVDGTHFGHYTGIMSYQVLGDWLFTVYGVSGVTVTGEMTCLNYNF